MIYKTNTIKQAVKGPKMNTIKLFIKKTKSTQYVEKEENINDKLKI